MARSARAYPHLANLLSGWFHQDFDLEGDTVEEIVDAFKASSPEHEREAVAGDISRFLEDTPEPVDAEFVRVFNPDIEPTGFAPTTREFLDAIRRRLSA